MIQRVEHEGRDQPIPKHLRIIVSEDIALEQRINDLVKRLVNCEFNPESSRTLVFCTSRKDTEEQSAAFAATTNNQGIQIWRAGAFHAGMSKEDRDDTFNRFKTGEIVVLFATKAFGMGMDVPNIHFVFHFKPPSSLEDFLQEIGRAGRNQDSRENAGFSEDNPIPCVLYASPDDFKRNKDWLHKKHLAWIELPRIQNAVLNYGKRIGAIVETEDSHESVQTVMQPFPLPLNLIEQSAEFHEAEDAASIQTMGLFWLEVLGRVKLGYYLPAYLEFANQPQGMVVGDEKVMALCKCIAEKQQEINPDESVVLVSSSDLFRAAGIRTLPNLLSTVVKAQRLGYVELLYKIRLKITKKRQVQVEEEWMGNNIEYCANGSPIAFPDSLPSFLEAGYEMTQSVLNAIPNHSPISLDRDWLFNECRQIAAVHFIPALETREEEKKAEKETKDFLLPSRAKAIMTLVRSCPGIRMSSDLEDQGIVYRISQDSREPNGMTPLKERQKHYIRDHKTVAQKALAYIQCKQISNQRISLTQMVIDLDVPSNSVKLLEEVLLHLRWMGYIKMGSLLPMATELYLVSTEKINESDQQSRDYRIFKQYEENRRLKTLRLAALQTLAELSKKTPTFGNKTYQMQREFLRAYFKSGSADEVLNLIETVLHWVDPEHEVLKALRQVAIKEKEAELSTDQKAVYEASESRSVLVAAGPGSGKTHTLLMRLARLIQGANVKPESILVLAYNRAVIVEIRQRLAELLTQLGYRSLVSSLRVFTFYGLVRYCLGDAVDPQEFNNNVGEPWIERFLEVANTEPGRITRRIDPDTLRYLFVDEYQDITSVRYKMLQWLARNHCSVTVIGDPDQSIYGYERANTGEPTRSADPYFHKFKADFDADTYTLRKNFRSFPLILKTAEALIEKNQSRTPIPVMQANRSPEQGWAQINNYATCIQANDKNWLDELSQILEEPNDNNRMYGTIAVLFRQNAEVYQAFHEVQALLKSKLKRLGITLSIQGDSGSLLRTREVGAIMSHITKLRNQTLIETGGEWCTEIIINTLLDKLSQPRWPLTWDTYTVKAVIALVRAYKGELNEDSTYSTLLDYLEDALARDQGQLQKLLQLEEKETEDNEVITVHRMRHLILSTFHKVKGLQFDAVIIPASRTKLLPELGQNPNGREFIELVEEERRLRYVGMTRARDRLITVHGPREAALSDNNPFNPDFAGLPAIEGLLFDGDAYDGRQILFKPANAWFIRNVSGLGSEESFFNYLHKEVSNGDPLVLTHGNQGTWYLQHDIFRVGQLSSGQNGANRVTNWLNQNELTHCEALGNLSVTEIIRFTLQESLELDSKANPATNYTNNWSPFFINKGFTYILNFAGYAKSVID